MISSGALILFFLPLACSAPVTLDEAQEYLQTYGYVRPPSITTNGVIEDEKTTEQNEIKRFQAVAGLQQTGEFDEPTLRKIAQPRCGAPEFSNHSSGIGLNWKIDKSVITFSIENTAKSMYDEILVRYAIRAAFATYQSVTAVKFEEAGPGEGDLRLKFASRGHDCLRAFDGKGRVVAHAYFPKDGRIHFDDDEHWTHMNARNLRTSTETDLLTVAIHEIGHALGLDHTTNDHLSTMAPFYNPPVDAHGNYAAPRIDPTTVAALQRRYGKPPTVARDKSADNSNCLNHVYAGLNLPNKRIMLFPDKGTRVIEFSTTTKQQTANFPVEEVFTSGPLHVSGAYYNAEDSYIMLFSGHRVWRYNYDQRADSVGIAQGYPKQLPTVGGDWHTGGAIFRAHERVIVNYQRKVAFFNEAKHSLRVTSQSLVEVYPNMPAAVAGFVDFEGNGRNLGFTETKVFEYDFDRNTHKERGVFSDYLEC